MLFQRITIEYQRFQRTKANKGITKDQRIPKDQRTKEYQSGKRIKKANEKQREKQRTKEKREKKGKDPRQKNKVVRLKNESGFSFCGLTSKKPD